MRWILVSSAALMIVTGAPAVTEHRLRFRPVQIDIHRVRQSSASLLNFTFGCNQFSEIRRSMTSPCPWQRVVQMLALRFAKL